MADLNQIISLGLGSPADIAHFVLVGLSPHPVAEIYRIPVEERFGWQRPALSFLGTPPGGPTKGDRYVVAAGATGAWSGHDDSIVWWNGVTWKFDVPAEGWGIFNIDDSTLYFLIAGAWTPY